MRVNATPTFTANAALAPYLRVKISSSKLVVAGAEDLELGTMDQRVLAADDAGAVVPRNVEGTVKMVASAAITQFANVYGAASGKISSTVNANFVGIALQAASGDNSIMEVQRSEPVLVTADGPFTQSALTNTATVTAAQLLTKVLDGTPTAAATYTLPTAALLVAAIAGAKVGDAFLFVVNNKSGGANTITMAAGSGGTADGTLTVAQNVCRSFLVFLTNVTAASEAYFVYGNG